MGPAGCLISNNRPAKPATASRQLARGVQAARSHSRHHSDRTAVGPASRQHSMSGASTRFSTLNPAPLTLHIVGLQHTLTNPIHGSYRPTSSHPQPGPQTPTPEPYTPGAGGLGAGTRGSCPGRSCSRWSPAPPRWHPPGSNAPGRAGGPRTGCAGHPTRRRSAAPAQPGPAQRRVLAGCGAAGLLVSVMVSVMREGHGLHGCAGGAFGVLGRDRPLAAASCLSTLQLVQLDRCAQDGRGTAEEGAAQHRRQKRRAGMRLACTGGDSRIVAGMNRPAA